MTPVARISTSLAILFASGAAFAGSLTPPAGPVAPTPGPEPRIAINATNTPGDADSLYRITQPGSYYLAGNLAGVVGKHGIQIAASGVSIDLMGFVVQGVAGSLTGITSEGSPAGIQIHNGTVRSWDDDGIGIGGFGAHVDGITATDNQETGISVGQISVVTDCTAYENEGIGIFASTSSVLRGCTARQNSIGIATAFGCSVIGCTALTNLGTGINVGDGSNVHHSTALNTTGVGIEGSSGCTISGCTSNNNTGDGIQVVSDCLVTGNTCDGNGQSADGAGIHVTSSDNRIEGNSCTDADRGIEVDAAGNVIIRNTCAGNTTSNWDVVAGNVIYVIAATNAAAVVGDSGGISPGSSNPNANYTY